MNKTIGCLVMLAMLGLSCNHPLSAQTRSDPKKEERNIDKRLQDLRPSGYPMLMSRKGIKGDTKDDDLRKLLLERFDAALEEMNVRLLERPAGGLGAETLRLDFFEQLSVAAQQLVDARLELAKAPEEEMAIREEFVDLAKEIEKKAKVKLDNGRVDLASYARTRHLRSDAEIQLLKTKRKVKK
jgi:hypothetical protein